jgi:very-short-patch-repair endonuclease
MAGPRTAIAPTRHIGCAVLAPNARAVVPCNHVRSFLERSSLRMCTSIEERIGSLARRQHGVVTRAQLLELGLSPKAVRHRAKTHRLRQLHRGVYLVGPIMPARAREMAAVLAIGLYAGLSHWSAAWLWRLISPQRGDTPVDVSVVGGNHAGRTGIRLHRVSRLDPDERAIVDAIPTTTVARTLVDLASVTDGRSLERAIATAEREKLIGRPELESMVTRYRGWPGMRALRAVLAENNGPLLTRSEAEARFLSLIRKARLPAPKTNVMVEGYEVDFLWPVQRIVVEVDGYRYHGSRPQFEKDRRRATELAARGIQVISLSWRQIVNDSLATAVQLGQALVRAERR